MIIEILDALARLHPSVERNEPVALACLTRLTLNSVDPMVRDDSEDVFLEPVGVGCEWP